MVVTEEMGIFLAVGTAISIAVVVGLFLSRNEEHPND